MAEFPGGMDQEPAGHPVLIEELRAAFFAGFDRTRTLSFYDPWVLETKFQEWMRSRDLKRKKEP